MPNTVTLSAPTAPTGSPWLTVAQVAEARQVDHKSVRRAIARGDLEARKFGQLIRVNPESFEAWGLPVGLTR